LLSLLVFVVFLFRAVNSSAVFIIVKVDDPFLVFVMLFASSSDFDSSTTLAAPPKSFLPVIVDLSNPNKK
jgi:hypothetical protein